MTTTTENTMKRLTITLATTLVLSACATSGANYRPLVDMQGHSEAQFDVDVLGCQQYAKQVMSAGQGAAAGAIFGALLGAALGKAAGAGNRTGRIAAGGALGGASSGAAAGEGGQQGVIKRCMAGRGYNVLY